MRQEDLIRAGHLTLMSVVFGAALAFLFNLASQGEWTFATAMTALLTFCVVTCIWWWYLHLGTAFPSTNIASYFADFLIGAGLCYMALCISTDALSPFKWTCGWGGVAVFAALKAWLGTRPIVAGYEKLVWWARVTTSFTVLLAFFAAVSAYQGAATSADPEQEPPTLFWFLTWVPVIGGIVVTALWNRWWQEPVAADQSD